MTYTHIILLKSLASFKKLSQIESLLLDITAFVVCGIDWRPFGLNPSTCDTFKEVSEG